MKAPRAPAVRGAQRSGGTELLKMSELARRCELPAATIKHYIREGLVPPPTLRTSRNMAYYDAGLVPRIRAIKEVQRTQFLPLRLIKDAIIEAPEAGADLVERCLARSLAQLAQPETRSRAQLIEAGMPEEQLVYFEGLGILSPERNEAGEAVYRGDDLALLRTLGAARRAGITAEMVPHTVLEPYMRAIGQLVKVELSLFRSGIVPKSSTRLPELVDHAAKLSEQLILLLRRKMLLPILAELEEEATERPAARTTDVPPSGQRRTADARKRRR